MSVNLNFLLNALHSSGKRVARASCTRRMCLMVRLIKLSALLNAGFKPKRVWVCKKKARISLLIKISLKGNILHTDQRFRCEILIPQIAVPGPVVVCHRPNPMGQHQRQDKHTEDSLAKPRNVPLWISVGLPEQQTFQPEVTCKCTPLGRCLNFCLRNAPTDPVQRKLVRR